MKTKWVLGMLAMILALFLPLAYSQQLTEKEKQIFYEAMELDMNSPSDISEEEADNAAREFASNHGVTYERVQDIMKRGNNMPLTATEEKAGRELHKMISAYEIFPPPDTFVKICSEVAAKYRMSVGQVLSIYFRQELKAPD